MATLADSSAKIAEDTFSWLAETATAYSPFGSEKKTKPMVVQTRERSRSRSAPRPMRVHTGLAPAVARAQSFRGGGIGGAKMRRRSSASHVKKVINFEVMGEEELSDVRRQLEARGLLLRMVTFSC